MEFKSVDYTDPRYSQAVQFTDATSRVDPSAKMYGKPQTFYYPVPPGQSNAAPSKATPPMEDAPPVVRPPVYIPKPPPQIPEI
jgi:hypothetical protein